MENAIADNRKRIKETDRLIERICEDNINGKETVAIEICFTRIVLLRPRGGRTQIPHSGIIREIGVRKRCSPSWTAPFIKSSLCGAPALPAVL